MKFLFLIPLLVSFQLSDPAYQEFQEIESLDEYKESKSFFVVNLKMVPSDPGMATLSWEAHKSLNKFMVELYDGQTGELFHRKLYRSKSIEIPASAQASVMPIHLNMHGKAKSTSMAASNAKLQQQQRKRFEEAMRQLQESDYGNNYSNKREKEIPWRWIIRGIGILALIIGLIARFSGKNAEFKDYDRRNRRR